MTAPSPVSRVAVVWVSYDLRVAVAELATALRDAGAMVVAIDGSPPPVAQDTYARWGHLPVGTYDVVIAVGSPRDAAVSLAARVQAPLATIDVIDIDLLPGDVDELLRFPTTRQPVLAVDIDGTRVLTISDLDVRCRRPISVACCSPAEHQQRRLDHFQIGADPDHRDSIALRTAQGAAHACRRLHAQDPAGDIRVLVNGTIHRMRELAVLRHTPDLEMVTLPGTPAGHASLT